MKSTKTPFQTELKELTCLEDESCEMRMLRVIKIRKEDIWDKVGVVSVVNKMREAGSYIDDMIVYKGTFYVVDRYGETMKFDSLTTVTSNFSGGGKGEKDWWNQEGNCFWLIIVQISELPPILLPWSLELTTFELEVRGVYHPNNSLSHMSGLKCIVWANNVFVGLPVWRTDRIMGTFEKLGLKQVVKTTEETITIDSDNQTFRLLSDNDLVPYRDIYCFMNIGLVQVAFKPFTLRGLPENFIAALRDSRNHNWKKSLIGMIQTSLAYGLVYFNAYPNLQISLHDENSLSSVYVKCQTLWL
ncbi:hypothetical protein H5410_004222 [Solanum commersonii]|uniref:Uncharacterized protein n=1 Tax=Solanum commersonii TaxID=4109 RepID=A0A9J6B757_SOLCO|nr:hypothetical protein H5410_004222 [Solanum commersonii]